MLGCIFPREAVEQSADRDGSTEKKMFKAVAAATSTDRHTPVNRRRSCGGEPAARACARAVGAYVDVAWGDRQADGDGAREGPNRVPPSPRDVDSAARVERNDTSQACRTPAT